MPPTPTRSRKRAQQLSSTTSRRRLLSADGGCIAGPRFGALEKTSGTVVKFDKHEDIVTIKANSGAEESFHIDDKTVAETAVGAVDSHKYDPEMGDQVRVVATSANGGSTALFYPCQVAELI